MRRLWDTIAAYFLPEGEFTIQKGFYQGACLVAGLMAIFVIIPINAFQTLPALVNLTALLFGLLAFGLYRLARRDRYYPGVLLASLLVVLNVDWFPNAASTGSIIYYFYAAALYPVIFFRGVRRWATVAFVIVNGSLLIWAEYWWPPLVTPFQSNTDRLIDLSGGLVVSMVGCVLLTWVVISGYDRERRRMRVTLAALDESREQLSRLFELNPDAVYLVDVDPPRFRDVNEGFERLFGWSKPEVVGRTAFELGLWSDLADRERFYAELEDGQRAEGFQARLRRRDGSEFWAATSARRVEVGGRACLLVTARDVTEEIRGRRAETERARMELQLLQAQKMESLGKLAGGVAHDFNNMLVAILGYTELLLLDERDESRRERLEAILGAAKRSADLTRKLLAFARRGKNVVESVAMSAVARDLVPMLTPSLTRDVEVVLELEDTWPVDADPSQMNQLLVNLCINAGEAMPNGGRLMIRTTDATLDETAARRLGLERGDYVALQVNDTGLGMTGDTRARIFEPFFTTKIDGEVKGTGLGLSTVYGIVDMHHGAIEVDSTPGSGTTFTVYLPRGHREPERAVPQPPPEDGQGLVLVIDDELMVRRVATAALERLGYQVVTAEDGDAGVAIFRARHRDLSGVLLDLKMPKKGGRETFVELRDIDPAVPVIVCTGYGDNEEAQGLISLGALALLAKPFKVRELSEQLARARGSAGAADAE